MSVKILNRRFVFASQVFVFCVLSLALFDAHAVGSSGIVSLDGVDIQLNGDGGGQISRVYLYNLPISADGCANTVPVLLLDGPNQNPVGKTLYATLLLAKATGKHVIVQTTGCWDVWSTPIITSMYIKD
jgi:hypothetical protein